MTPKPDNPSRLGRAPFPIEQAMETLRIAARDWKTPIVTVIADRRDPFLVLISTILSLRTKDETTADASRRLFALAETPAAMLAVPEPRIAEAIFPVGFYKTKARTILDICDRLEREHVGRVPDTLEGLLALKGVGRKTANLVLTLGFEKPGICVDTHVHRIANRWDYVRTPNPDATELALRAVLPERYWIPINDWLVAFGQNVCVPVSPFCSRCPLAAICPRRDVARSR